MGVGHAIAPWGSHQSALPARACGAQLVSSKMGVVLAALAVTMLLAVALSGSDEGSGLAVKSAKFTKAKAQTQSLHHMEKVSFSCAAACGT